MATQVQLSLLIDDGLVAYGQFWDAIEQAGPVNSVAVMRGGNIIVSGGADGSIRLRNLNGDLASTLEGHAGPVNVLAATPDGSGIVSGGADP
jgi:WD40 repeat protein